MAELVGGAVLQVALGELLTEVVLMTKRTARFKSLLKRLESTLGQIQPKVDEISAKLGHLPEEEMKTYMSYLKDGKELVSKCSRVKFWNILKKLHYANRLIILDGRLWRLSRIDDHMNIAMIRIAVDDLKNNQMYTKRAGGFSGLCSVPGIPEVIVGMDHHLAAVKRTLLKNDTKVLVISAPGGCGKTTLAKMLCHDEEIKGTYRENILYVTVSRPSSLKTIAQALLEHHGMNHHEFRSDEEAKNQIEKLLKMGPGNKLLVLDDLWDESGFLVEDLNFQIQGFKILVTSRFLFKCFSSIYNLSLLSDKDSKTLLHHHAFKSYVPPVKVPDDVLNKIVKSCKGLPLALTVVGKSLCGQPVTKWRDTLKKWSEGQSILQSHVLPCLQTSIDALCGMHKGCFLDLGSFPEDDRISSTSLMDMWLELYDLDDEGSDAIQILLDLSDKNLINLVPIRKYASEIEGYCSEHYVTQHDLLRELAIHQSSQEPLAQRKRLFIEIHANKFPKWWTQKTEQPADARILSISTDEKFSSSWDEYDLNAPNVEVLILNIRSKRYTLPQFIKKMSLLKVLIVKGYGTYSTQLDKLSCLASLSNLRRIRFEYVSVSSSIQVIFKLPKLKKLAFVTCKIGDALMSCTIKPSYTLPSLIDLEIDSCYDLKELPSGVGNIVHLEKLSITNCHELDALPDGLEGLSHLKTLNLHSCTKLQELPKSIGSMHGLMLIDISDCLGINVLPEQIGELSGLKVLKMIGCQGLKELPVSISKLSQLEDVLCDEESSYLWKNLENDLGNVNINFVQEDRLWSFLKLVQ